MEKDEKLIKFDLTPDVSMMTKIHLTGYSFSQYLFELIDNSLDHMLEKLKVDITIGDTITISDNASGMTMEQLAKAMVLAFVDPSTKKPDSKGLYGIGLKAACTGLGDYFEITTYTDGEKESNKTIWNQDIWLKNGKWEGTGKKVPIPEELSFGHGTLIKIKKLKIKTGAKIGIAKADIGSYYSPLINKGLLEVFVNGERCWFPEPSLIEGKRWDVDITTPSGKKITGWVGLLEHSSQKGQYGFNTFRHGRMIGRYEKLGFDTHPTHARIYGELNLNHVPVSINKTSWDTESTEYEEAVECIEKFMKPIIKESEEKAKEKKVDLELINKIEQFKEGIAEALKSPELKDYTAPERVGLARPGETSSGEGMEAVEVEKRDKGIQKGTREPADTGRKRIPKRTHPSKRSTIKIKGKEFHFDWKWVHYGEKGDIYDYAFDKTQKPEELLERIIKASSNPGDIILDPFCGCGTLLSVAAKLNRKFIGIDIYRMAVKVMENRLKVLQAPPLFLDFTFKTVIPETLDVVASYDSLNFHDWVCDKLGAYKEKGENIGWLSKDIEVTDVNKRKINLPKGTLVFSQGKGKEMDIEEMKSQLGTKKGVLVGFDFPEETIEKIHFVRAEDLVVMKKSSPYDYKVPRPRRLT